MATPQQPEPWVIPVVSLAANLVLSPILLSWLNKRKEKREDKGQDFTHLLESAKLMKEQLTIALTENDKLTTHYDALRTIHHSLLTSEENRRQADLKRIEELERRIAHANAQRVFVCRKIEAIERAFEIMASLVEKSRRGSVDSEGNIRPVDERGRRLAAEIDRVFLIASQSGEGLTEYLKEG